MAVLRGIELLLGFLSAPRILSCSAGFWSKIPKFIRPFMKSPFKMVLLNQKLKKGSATPFLLTLFIYLQKKIINVSPISLWLLHNLRKGNFA